MEIHRFTFINHATICIRLAFPTTTKNIYITNICVRILKLLQLLFCSTMNDELRLHAYERKVKELHVVVGNVVVVMFQWFKNLCKVMIILQKKNCSRTPISLTVFLMTCKEKSVSEFFKRWMNERKSFRGKWWKYLFHGGLEDNFRHTSADYYARQENTKTVVFCERKRVHCSLFHFYQKKTKNFFVT